MKIERIEKIAPTQRPSRGSETGPKKTPYKVSDSVELSRSGKERSIVLEHMNDQDDKRMKRLQELKKEIQESRYEINDKMMESIIMSIFLYLS